jgi:hypothetical protein
LLCDFLCVSAVKSSDEVEKQSRRSGRLTDVGAPVNRIFVLTPRLPQHITPVLELGIVRFGWFLS